MSDSPGGNSLDFAMSLSIETGEATSRIHDIWDAARKMESEKIMLTLGMRTDFQKAETELGEVQAEVEKTGKAFKVAEQKAAEFADKIKNKLAALDIVAEGAGQTMLDAFKAKGADGAARAMDGLLAKMEEMSKVNLAANIVPLSKELDTLKKKMGAVAEVQRMDSGPEFMKLFERAGRLGQQMKSNANNPKELEALSLQFEAVVGNVQQLALGLSNTGEEAVNAIASMIEAFNGLKAIDQQIIQLEKSAAAAKDENAAGAFRLTAQLLQNTGLGIESLANVDTAAVQQQIIRATEVMQALTTDGKGIKSLVRKMMTGALEILESGKGGLKAEDEERVYKASLEKFQTAYVTYADIIQKAAMDSARGAGANLLGGKEGMGGMLAGILRGVGGGGGMPSITPGALATGVAEGGRLAEMHVGVMHVDVLKVSKIESPANGFDLSLNQKSLTAQIESAFRAAAKGMNLSGLSIKLDAKAEANADATATATVNAAGNPAAGRQRGPNGRFLPRDPSSMPAPKPHLDPDAAATMAAGVAGATADTVEQVASRVADKTASKRKTKSKEEREAEARTAAETALDAEARRAAIKSDPVAFIRKFAPEHAPAAEGIVAANAYRPKEGDAKDAEKQRDLMGRAATAWPLLAKALADKGHELGANGASVEDLEDFARASKEFSTRYGRKSLRFNDEQDERSMNRAATAAAKDRAREAYNAKIADRTRSRDVYADFSDVRIDRYKDRMTAYEQVIKNIGHYERNLVGYTHAATPAEQARANEHINGSLRELEVSKDILNSRLLAGEKRQFAVRQVASEFRSNGQGGVYADVHFVKDAAGQFKTDQMEAMEAYKRTSLVLRDTLMPALEKLNEQLRKDRQAVLDAARARESEGDQAGADELYKKASAMRERTFEGPGGILPAVAQFEKGGPTSPLADRVAQGVVETMRLTAAQAAEHERLLALENGEAVAEEFKLKVAKERLALLGQEVRTYEEIGVLRQRQLGQTQLLARYDNLQAQRQDDPHGLKRATRGLANYFGFYAGGMQVGLMAQGALREGIGFEKEMREIQGVLGSKSPSERNMVSDAIGKTANQYGASLTETAEAAKVLAQAGYGADKVMKELNTTMMGMRGLGMSIEQMNELKIAIHSVDESISSDAILEKISHVESQYAVSAQGLAAALKISAPFIKEFAKDMRGMQDFVDFQLGATTVMTEKLRTSGQQSGNAMQFIMTRMLKPGAVAKLQNTYGLKLGTEEGNLLPIDQLFGQISSRYNELKGSGKPGDSVQAQAMLAQIAGAHRVKFLSALMNDDTTDKTGGYARAMKIATESANSWGEAQYRSQLVMDSFGAKIQVARNSFQLLANDMVQHSIVFAGFKGILEAIGSALTTVVGSGGGGMPAVLAMGGLAGLGIKGFKGASYHLGVARDSYLLGGDTTYSGLRDDLAARRAAQIADRYGMRTSAPKSLFEEVEHAGGTAAGGLARGVAVAEKEAVVAAGAMDKVGKAMAGAGRAATGFVNLVGPTTIILGGLALALTAIGMAYRHWHKEVDDAKDFRVKIKPVSNADLFDSPQIQKFDADTRALGFENVYKGNDAVQRAMHSDEVKGVLAKYGAADFAEMQARTMEGAPNKLAEPGKAAVEVMQAMLDSGKLGEQATQKIRSMGSAAEQWATVSRLVGESAFAASYQMSIAIASLRDQLHRMKEMTSTRLESFNTPQGSGFLNKVKSLFTDSDLLTRDVGMNGYEPFSRLKSGKAGVQQALGSILDKDNVPAELAKVFNNPASAFAKALDQAIDALVKGGQKSLSLADALSKMSEMLDASDNTLDQQITTAYIAPNGRYAEKTEMGNMRQRIIQQIGDTMLAQSGYREQVEALHPGSFNKEGRPHQTTAVEFINDILTKSAEYAEATGRAFNTKKGGKTDQAFDDVQMGEFTKHMTAMKLSLQGAGGALTVFKDKLLDLVLSLYTETVKLESSATFAKRHGETYDRPQEEMGLIKKFAESFSTITAEMAAEVTKKRAEFENMRISQGMGQLPKPGPDGKIPDEEPNILDGAPQELTGIQAARQQMITRYNELHSQLTAYQDQFNDVVNGMYTMAKILPGSTGEMITKYLNEHLKTVDGNPIAQQQLVASVAEALNQMYDKPQAADTARKLGTVMREHAVSRLGRLTELGREGLDLEPDMEKRTAAREAVEQSLMELHLRDLAIQERRGEISTQQYQIKVQELVLDQAANLEYERRAQLVKATVELQKQALANLSASVNGFVKGVGDLDLFAAMFSANGKGAKHEAQQKYMQSMLKGMIDPMTERVRANFTKTLTDMLSSKSGLMEIFKSPELDMKSNIQDAGKPVSLGFYDSIVKGGAQAAALIQAAVAGQIPKYDPTAGIVIGAGAAGTGASGLFKNGLGKMSGQETHYSAGFRPVDVGTLQQGVQQGVPDDGVAPENRGKIYRKDGHYLYDTANEAGTRGKMVPTFRLDAPSGRRPYETWEHYAHRVSMKPASEYPKAAFSANQSLDSLDPEVRDKFKTLIAEGKKAGFQLHINEARRPQERQEQLFGQGRGLRSKEPIVTWTLTSNHLDGRAIDVKVGKGTPKEQLDFQAFAAKQGFSVMGALDYPHIAMPKPPYVDPNTPRLDPVIVGKLPPARRNPSLAMAMDPGEVAGWYARMKQDLQDGLGVSGLQPDLSDGLLPTAAPAAGPRAATPGPGGLRYMERLKGLRMDPVLAKGPMSAAERQALYGDAFLGAPGINTPLSTGTPMAVPLAAAAHPAPPGDSTVVRLAQARLGAWWASFDGHRGEASDSPANRAAYQFYAGPTSVRPDRSVPSLAPAVVGMPGMYVPVAGGPATPLAGASPRSRPGSSTSFGLGAWWNANVAQTWARSSAAGTKYRADRLAAAAAQPSLPGYNGPDGKTWDQIKEGPSIGTDWWASVQQEWQRRGVEQARINNGPAKSVGRFPATAPSIGPRPPAGGPVILGVHMPLRGSPVGRTGKNIQTMNGLPIEMTPEVPMMYITAPRPAAAAHAEIAAQVVKAVQTAQAGSTTRGSGAPLGTGLLDGALQAGYKNAVRPFSMADALAENSAIGTALLPDVGIDAINLGTEMPLSGYVPPNKMSFWDKYHAHGNLNPAQQLMAGAGQMGGQMLGTAMGRGSPAAQIASQIGSSAGAIVGQALIPIPGVGAMIGGLAGGMIGGLFKGKKPGPEKDIPHLDAIEFNTKETISAIEQQTDKLTRPGNSVMNLPTSFSVPGYAPQFSGGATGGVMAGGDSYQITLGDVNVGDGANVSKTEIRQAIKEGVAEAINAGRSAAVKRPRSY